MANASIGSPLERQAHADPSPMSLKAEIRRLDGLGLDGRIRYSMHAALCGNSFERGARSEPWATRPPRAIHPCAAADLKACRRRSS